MDAFLPFTALALTAISFLRARKGGGALPGTAGYSFPIGQPGVAWGAAERKRWLAYVGSPRRL